MEIFVKDMELGRFVRKLPEWYSLAAEMRLMLPDGYANYLVDLVVMDCEPGVSTCRDTRWHVDGDPNKDNRYALWVSGPNRTEFLRDPFELPDMPKGREEQNALLEELLADKVPLRIPDGEAILYDSRTPHRGVVCEEYGRRMFLRLMATNYIKTKNILKRGDNVPFRSGV